ncbi:MAG: hypothetical protein R6W06_10405 [Prochlorococcaceae cyanobacterium]
MELEIAWGSCAGQQWPQTSSTPPLVNRRRPGANGLLQHGIHDGDLLVIDRSVEPCSGGA